ncbi:MAG: CCA tRNA nucleotidyltransferase, partial [Candidatus Kapaibacterium sp.]
MKNQVHIHEPLIHAVGDIASAVGTNLYLVGGYVRDLLRGHIGNDIDFTIEGSGVEFARIVARKFGTQPIIFERFGTAMVPVNGYKLEFVGTRKEEYAEGSRKPIVTEGTLEDDLRRRDFTVNAMAIKIGSGATGEIIDLFNGLEDLQRKILRTPLDPITTYSDDPLRMMRAARFSAQLGFELEPASFQAIVELRERIGIISQERISEEFLKMMAAPKPSIGLALLFESGLLELVFPEVQRLDGVDLVKAAGITYAHKNVFWHTLTV